MKIHHINDDLCALLPAGILALSMEEGLIRTKGASQLPRSLKTLKTYFEVFENNQVISYLGHISKLELKTAQLEPRGGLDEYWLSSLLPSRSCSKEGHLYDCASDDDGNQHLTSLVVQGVEGKINRFYAQEPFFKALLEFKNLRTLKIRWHRDISSDWLRLIPKNVTSLSIESLNAYPSAAQLSTLPNSLTYLNLDVERESCDWKDETLQSLPGSLQVFWINGSFPSMTRRAYEYLPPNVHSSFLSRLPARNYQ